MKNTLVSICAIIGVSLTTQVSASNTQELICKSSREEIQSVLDNLNKMEGQIIGASQAPKGSGEYVAALEIEKDLGEAKQIVKQLQMAQNMRLKAKIIYAVASARSLDKLSNAYKKYLAIHPAQTTAMDIAAGAVVDGYLNCLIEQVKE